MGGVVVSGPHCIGSVFHQLVEIPEPGGLKVNAGIGPKSASSIDAVVASL